MLPLGSLCPKLRTPNSTKHLSEAELITRVMEGRSSLSPERSARQLRRKGSLWGDKPGWAGQGYAEPAGKRENAWPLSKYFLRAYCVSATGASRVSKQTKSRPREASTL